jgi:branched-chain amino acid transport system permease protein
MIVAALSMYCMYRIINSPFGSTLQGIRDNAVRSEAIGVNVRRHQLAAMVIAGFLQVLQASCLWLSIIRFSRT